MCIRDSPISSKERAHGYEQFLQAPFNLFQVESKGFLYSRGKEGFQPIKQFAENLRPLEAWGRDIPPLPSCPEGVRAEWSGPIPPCPSEEIKREQEARKEIWHSLKGAYVHQGISRK